MLNSNKNTYVRVTTSGGLDWHDISTWSNFLKEGGKFEIKNVFEVIAKHVYEELQKMHISTSNPESKTVLESIPSLEEVTEYICDKKTFKVTSKDGYELEAYWDPVENTLNQYFYAGQVSYHVYYDIKEIAPENLIYIAIENFLCPMKGISSVERFYKAPFTNLEDAQKECERIRAAIKERVDDRVQSEPIIADCNVITKTDWYKYNMQVIDILAAHPEIDNEENFKVLVQPHLDALKEKLAA